MSFKGKVADRACQIVTKDFFFFLFLLLVTGNAGRFRRQEGRVARFCFHVRRQSKECQVNTLHSVVVKGGGGLCGRVDRSHDEQ